MPVKISVVTPSYNQAIFIDATLRSVINQDYGNFEYIVVDGGSSDGSADIIRSYHDDIDLTIIEPDKGQSDAINKGFERAIGEVICWVNSDDVLLPGALTAVADYFEEHPDCQWLAGDCLFTDIFLKTHWHYKAKERPAADYLLFGEGVFLAQPSVFFSKSLWQQAGKLNQGLHYCMDTEMWLRFHTLAPLHILNKDLSINRQYPNTKTSSGKQKVVKEIATAIFSSQLNKQAGHSYKSLEKSIRANFMTIERYEFRTGFFTILNNMFSYGLTLKEKMYVVATVAKNLLKKLLGRQLPG